MSVIKEEYISESVTIHDVLPLSFLKKSPYTGSKRGMRYRQEKFVPDEGTAEPVLRVSVWPEPYAFAETEPEKIVSRDFPFSKEGIEESVVWLNTQLPRFQV